MSTPGLAIDGTQGNEEIRGTGGDDSIAGYLGNDAIYGGRGDDFVWAGAGNDIVYVGMGNDYLHGGEGMDVVSFLYLDRSHDGLAYEHNRYGVTFDLNKTTQNLGILGIDTIVSFENINGSLGNDLLFGNGGANAIVGAEGNDTIDGRAGNDILIGHIGADRLIGGAGADRLDGFDYGARDTFIYRAISDSGITASTRDSIIRFFHPDGATGDRIDLHLIDANRAQKGNQAFAFVSTFHANKYGEVKVTYSGADTIVSVDIDRDAAAEMSIFVQGVHLVRSDFIL